MPKLFGGGGRYTNQRTTLPSLVGTLRIQDRQGISCVCVNKMLFQHWCWCHTSYPYVQPLGLVYSNIFPDESPEFQLVSKVPLHIATETMAHLSRWRAFCLQMMVYGKRMQTATHHSEGKSTSLMFMEGSGTSFLRKFSRTFGSTHCAARARRRGWLPKINPR